METYNLVSQIRRSGNLCGFEIIVNMKFQNMFRNYWTNNISSLSSC